MDRVRNMVVSLVFLLAGGALSFAQGGYQAGGTVVDSFGPVIGAAVVEQYCH